MIFFFDELHLICASVCFIRTITDLQVRKLNKRHVAGFQHACQDHAVSLFFLIGIAGPPSHFYMHAKLLTKLFFSEGPQSSAYFLLMNNKSTAVPLLPATHIFGVRKTCIALHRILNASKYCPWPRLCRFCKHLPCLHMLSLNKNKHLQVMD